VDELANDRQTASVKPLLLVAAMLVAAALGAVVTLRPVSPGRQPPHRPSAGVVVIEGPGDRIVHRLHPASRPVPSPDWV
jgi:hypothetical protein